jgi:D-glycero-D-manno-heptose 1,7-bisphosphate phosphatase
MTRLVLIDRDGTLNVNKHYLSDPAQFELIPRAAEAIKLLSELGLTNVVITNQSAIGRGFFDEKQLTKIHDKLKELLAAEGAKIDAVYFCPHTPDDNCNCRKPLPQMAYQAATDFSTDLKKSFVIGDNECDIELGKNISATTILVRTGHGIKTEREGKVSPDYTVENIYEAAVLIADLL